MSDGFEYLIAIATYIKALVKVLNQPKGPKHRMRLTKTETHPLLLDCLLKKKKIIK